MKNKSVSFIARNRILIGIITLVIALIGAFVILPTATKAEEYEVFMLNKDISSGSAITDKDYIITKTTDKLIAKQTVYKKEQLKNKVAQQNLKKDNYLFLSDLVDGTKTTANNIPAGKELIAVAIKDMAMEVSYQLKAGDIVKIYGYDSKTDVTTNYPELQYVEVEGVYNANGIDLDSYNSDEAFVPSALNLIVNQKQAERIVALNAKSSVYFSLISRGNNTDKQAFLAKQENLIK